jgi:fructose-1,6-bisphosphatase II
LRMIADGDIAAALAPALRRSNVDLYAGIGGAPEGVLAAAALRCLGGGMQAQIWPRDDAERRSLEEAAWGDRLETVYRSRDSPAARTSSSPPPASATAPCSGASRSTGRRP